jgi:hypothetical protein
MKQLEQSYRFWRMFSGYLSVFKSRSTEMVPLVVLLAIVDVVLVFFLPAVNKIEPFFFINGTPRYGVIWTVLSWIPATVYVALVARILLRETEKPEIGNEVHWAPVATIGLANVLLQVLLLFLKHKFREIGPIQFLISLVSFVVYPWLGLSISYALTDIRATTAMAQAIVFLFGNIGKVVVIAIFLGLFAVIAELLVVVIVRAIDPLVPMWEPLLFMSTFLGALLLPLMTVLFVKITYFPDSPRWKTLTD